MTSERDAMFQMKWKWVQAVSFHLQSSYINIKLYEKALRLIILNLMTGIQYSIVNSL